MKIKSTNKLSAIICVICGLIFLPLTAPAEYLVVDGTAHPAESGTTYTSTSGANGYAALTVTGSSEAGKEGSYTGTDILLSGIIPTVSATNGSKAAIINNGGALFLTGGTVQGSRQGINLTGASSAVLDNVYVNITSTFASTSGIYLADSSTLTMTGGTVAQTQISGSQSFNINLTGSSSAKIDGTYFWLRKYYSTGINVADSSTLLLTDAIIDSSIPSAKGIVLTGTSSGTVNGLWYVGMDQGMLVENSSTLTLFSGTFQTVSSHDIVLSGSSNAKVDGSIFELSGSNVMGISATNSTLTLTDSVIREYNPDGTSNVNQRGINLYGSSGTLKNVDITLSGTGNIGVSATNRSILSMDGGSIHVNSVGSISGGGYTAGISLTGNSSGTVSGVTIETGGDSYNRGVYVYNSSTLTLTDSDIITSNSSAYALYLRMNNTVTASLNHNTLTGIILVGDTSTLTLTLSGSETKLIGTATHDATSAINLTIEDGTRLNQLTGNINTLTLQNGATLSSDNSNGALLLNGAAITVTTDLLTLSDGTILDYNDNTLSLTGTLVIGNGIQIDFSDATLEDNQAYTILDWSNADLIGTVNIESFTAKNLASDMTGTFTVANNQLTFNATAIPEPSVYLLLGIGLGILLLTARRRNVQS